MMRPILVAAMFFCLHGPQTAGAALAETATPPTAIYALGRIRDRHVGPGLGQPHSQRPPDAAGRTRNQGVFPLET